MYKVYITIQKFGVRLNKVSYFIKNIIAIKNNFFYFKISSLQYHMILHSLA